MRDTRGEWGRSQRGTARKRKRDREMEEKDRERRLSQRETARRSKIEKEMRQTQRKRQVDGDRAQKGERLGVRQGTHRARENQRDFTQKYNISRTRCNYTGTEDK